MNNITSKKINLLELCLSKDLGGLELYVLDIVTPLKETFNLHLVLNNMGKMFDKALEKNISFDSIVSKRKFSIKAIYDLKKYISKHDIDVVHIHWVRDLPLIAMAKWLSKKKFRVIYTRHIPLKKAKKDFYHTWLYGKVDLTIAISQVIADELSINLPYPSRGKIKKLYAGTNADKMPTNEEKIALRKSILHDNPSDFIIGVFARIEPLKGQMNILRVFNRLIKNGCDVKLLFVGNVLDEAYHKEMQDFIQVEKIENDVIFTGFLNEPKKVMSVCDTVVLASKFEAFGLVLIEAMQMGTPVIASRVGGIPEIIDDGINGFLFDEEDDETMYALLIKLYNDRKLREKVSHAGQEKVRTSFNAIDHYQRLTAIISSII